MSCLLNSFVFRTLVGRKDEFERYFSQKPNVLLTAMYLYMMEGWIRRHGRWTMIADEVNVGKYSIDSITHALLINTDINVFTS